MGKEATQEEIRKAIDRFAGEDVSEKQQNFLASLIKQTHISGQDFKELIKEKSGEELTTPYSKWTASKLIEHLIELRDQNRESAKDTKPPEFSNGSKEVLDHWEKDIELQESKEPKTQASIPKDEEPPF